MTDYDVDIVITWVDGGDPVWNNQRDEYYLKDNPGEANNSDVDNSSVRFRDWDNLQYLFRGIEKFMPWVRKVFFVTWGHLPSWLDTKNEKLVIVNHKDFLPAEYLPTFNSNTLNLNLFRIPDLAERFIYFNDDFFVIKETKKEDFFVNGLPKDMACISPQPIHRDTIRNIELNNLKIINDYFGPDDVKKNKNKWLDFGKYGSHALRTMLFMKFSTIIGIYEPHIPFGQLKETARLVWEKEFNELDASSRRKFRSVSDESEWLFRQWQLMSGEFYPRSKNFGIHIEAGNIQDVRNVLRSGKQKVVCINDVSVEDFEASKKAVNEELRRLLPEKSAYEL